MNDHLAEELLDDIETDDKQIYSEKIKRYSENLLLLTHQYVMDIPMQDWKRLNGWK